MTKFCVLFSVLFCLSTSAQQTARSHKAGPLSEDNIINSKKEVKKEKHVHSASATVAKSNEHKARKKHHLGTKLFHKPSRKKVNKEKATKEKVIEEKKS